MQGIVFLYKTRRCAGGDITVTNIFHIRGIVTQTGCAGHCKDEPTVEITLPGRRPVLYGHVTAERVAELVERQIVRGETAEGLIEA